MTMDLGVREFYLTPRTALSGSWQTPPSGGWFLLLLRGMFYTVSKFSSFA